ncbi:MAG TPA: RNase adapter RapZ [Chiayiivirga sp.]|nr:RNase adapter RapZ [Chiayiivirga sp.]
MNESRAIKLLVLSGLSGSGKSVALRTLEDLDYYCVDNLPAELLPQFVKSLTASAQTPPRLAVGIDVRNRPDGLQRLPHSLAEVGRMGCQHELMFLDTNDEVLLRRYSETRRRHPLSIDGRSLADAIALERKQLQALVAIADRVLDTSGMNVHQLRRLIVTELGADAHPDLSLLVQSFAYRNGVPDDADFVFDVRCMPNPHWNPALRPLSGRDLEVRDYFAAHVEVGQYLAGVAGFLDTWLPSFESSTRSYVTVAFGCTGGRHRSVYCAEWLARHWHEQGRSQALAFHRELG